VGWGTCVVFNGYLECRESGKQNILLTGDDLDFALHISTAPKAVSRSIGMQACGVGAAETY
jgi:hypothetical protein